MLPPGDAGPYASVLQCFPQPIGVITVIPEQPVDLWQAAQERPRTDVVADLACGDEQFDQPPLAVADGMQLGVHPTFGATDQATAPPFSRPCWSRCGVLSDRPRPSSRFSFRGVQPPDRSSFVRRCLSRSTAFSGCRASCAAHRPQGVSPVQPTATDEDNPAQHAPVINPGFSVRLRKERLQMCHLLICQPEKIAHVTVPVSKP